MSTKFEIESKLNYTNDSHGSPSLIKDILRSLRNSLQPFLLSMILLVALLSFSIIISFYNNVPFSYLSRDVVSVVDQPIFIGFLSNLGMVGWSFGAGFCLIGFLLLHRENRKQAWFFMYAFLLTTLLLMDDLFLIHEELMPNVLNISTKIWFLVYIGSVIGFFVLFYKQILRSNYFLLLFAFGFFGLSIILDIQSLGLDKLVNQSSILFHDPATSVAGYKDHEDLAYFMEDGAKFGGILLWAIYFGITAVSFVKHSVKPMFRLKLD